MKLEIFKHNTTNVSSKGFRTISFNRKFGRITMSMILAESLGIEKTDGLYFARDTERRNAWYFKVAKKDKMGIVIHKQLVKRKTPKGYSESMRYDGGNRPLCEALLKDLKIEEGATFLVAEKPIMVDGTEWWGILTARPFRISKTKPKKI